MQAAAKIIPFAARSRAVRPGGLKPRHGLLGLGDFTPDEAFAIAYENTGDYDQAEAARQAYLAAGPMPSYEAPVNTPRSVPQAGYAPGFDMNSAVQLATIAAKAYTTQGQTAQGIAPQGYTYRGYANNIMSSAGNAPPGYTLSPISQNGTAYGAFNPYGQATGAGVALTPQGLTGNISPTMLMLFGLAALFVMQSRK